MPKSRQVCFGLYHQQRAVTELSRCLRQKSNKRAHFPFHTSQHQAKMSPKRSPELARFLTAVWPFFSGLVENRLAACVNIIPGLTSIYRWKGTIEKDNEVLLMIKSPSASLANLTTFVKSLHPYEVCEIISLPIQQGNPDYLQFLMDATAGGKH
ncbi:divalent-cation tolerance protein CutA-like isoform X1 [Varroa jacobsoni]|uniref:divalent-cation tolerance protein CutA-like isoform X1 n=1 Tax=Varroa jacobsoni TaxID=62625 RepID=UPI000BF7B2B8|nr:divalent-cation tolerance protein CutA-like isoform X1 [Varroa jacobsoni]